MHSVIKYVLISFFLFASLQQPTAQICAKFSGKLSNFTQDSILVRNANQKYVKVIRVNKDGTFSDTLRVINGTHVVIAGGQYDYMFLKNGFDLNLEADVADFTATALYSGKGSENTAAMKELFKLEEKELDESKFNELDSTALFNAFSATERKMDQFFNTRKNLDADALTWMVRYSGDNLTQMKRYYFASASLKKVLPAGSPSPEFFNYENYNGGTTSLKDLRGKFVYVDVWATWCGPCKAEIPNLKKLEEDYHNKNIAFVSISIDDPRRSGGGNMDAVKAKWRAMITDKKMGGVQLIADNNWNSDFVKGYRISGIPRFILIDPEGKIVLPDAPRPSSPKIREVFNRLKL